MIYNILYVKIPKTGSTSLRDTFIDYCNKNKIMYSTIAARDLNSIKKNIGASLGHVPYNLLIEKVKPKLILNREILTIASVREPLDKYFSHAAYLQRNVNHYNGLRAQGWDIMMDNQMCYYLGFRDLDSITKENIKSRFNYITVLDEWDKSMKGLRNILGTNITNYHSNKTTRPKQTKMKETLVKLFKKNNEMDYKLYELCRELYV